jgi:hypothetical protein
MRGKCHPRLCKKGRRPQQQCADACTVVPLSFSVQSKQERSKDTLRASRSHDWKFSSAVKEGGGRKDLVITNIIRERDYKVNEPNN